RRGPGGSRRGSCGSSLRVVVVERRGEIGGPGDEQRSELAKPRGRHPDGGAGDAQRRGGRAGVDRGGDGGQPGLELVDGAPVAAPADLVELALERVPVDDRARREAVELA